MPRRAVAAGELVACGRNTRRVTSPTAAIITMTAPKTSTVSGVTAPDEIEPARLDPSGTPKSVCVSSSFGCPAIVGRMNRA